jgi:hypothetical protein
MTNPVRDLLAAHHRRHGGRAVCLFLFDGAIWWGPAFLRSLRRRPTT